jgi:uncharacterized protein (DUF1778 family)
MKRKKPGPVSRGMTATVIARVTPDTRKLLESAARKAGHSLSREIEDRLVESFKQTSLRECIEALEIVESELDMPVEHKRSILGPEPGLSGRAILKIGRALASYRRLMAVQTLRMRTRR